MHASLMPHGRKQLALALLASALALPSAPSAAAATCHATSGRLTAPLVSLYTSEGCDSCPPADRWLSATVPVRKSDSATAPAVVALAFHVDYWDRLGWRDRFASAQFTQHQYAEMTSNSATFVYTPQVLVQGHPVEGWNRGKVPESIAAVARRPARAAIALDVTPDAEALRLNASATVSEPALRKNAVMWLAYTDSGHVTDVAAGENRGVRLHHDHVVRALLGPYAIASNGTAAAALTYTPPANRGSSPAIIAFVQDTAGGEVLQAVAATDCREP